MPDAQNTLLNWPQSLITACGGPVHLTKLSIQVHRPYMTTSKQLCRVNSMLFALSDIFLLCCSDFTIYTLLPEVIFNLCAPRMYFDTSVVGDPSPSIPMVCGGGGGGVGVSTRFPQSSRCLM